MRIHPFFGPNEKINEFCGHCVVCASSAARETNNNQHIHASTVSSSKRTFISQNESEKSVTATRCAATSLDLTRYCLQYKEQYVVPVLKRWAGKSWRNGHSAGH
jgi:hypothetical protein